MPLTPTHEQADKQSWLPQVDYHESSQSTLSKIDDKYGRGTWEKICQRNREKFRELQSRQGTPDPCTRHSRTGLHTYR